MHGVTGSRGAETGKQPWAGIDRSNIDYAMTDYWEPYEKFIPPGRHVQSKAETYTVLEESRRMYKNCERLVDSILGMMKLASICILLKRS